MPKVSQQHLDARRAQILDAASHCFSEKGFHSTTMKDIVRGSKLSPGAIYRYFDSKDDIIDAIAGERHSRENSVLVQALDDKEGGLRLLREVSTAFFADFASPRRLEERRVGVEVWAEALRNPRVLKIVRRGVDEPRAILAQVIRRLQEDGELSEHFDAEGMASVMVAIFQGFVLQQAWDPEIDTESYVRTVGDLIDLIAMQSEK